MAIFTSPYSCNISGRSRVNTYIFKCVRRRNLYCRNFMRGVVVGGFRSTFCLWKCIYIYATDDVVVLFSVSFNYFEEVSPAITQRRGEKNNNDELGCDPFSNPSTSHHPLPPSPTYLKQSCTLTSGGHARHVTSLQVSLLLS